MDDDRGARDPQLGGDREADRAVAWIGLALLVPGAGLWLWQAAAGRLAGWHALLGVPPLVGLAVAVVLAARGASRHRTTVWLAFCAAALIAAWALPHGGLAAPFLALLPLLPLAVFALAERASWGTALWIAALLAALAAGEWLSAGRPSSVEGFPVSQWAPAVWLAVAALLSAFLTRLHEQRAARTSRALQAHAVNDHLTGLANRRHFEARLGEECRRAARRDDPLAVIMLDVDRFKAFNDTHGHPHGDRCLVAVSYAISTCVRRGGDLLARFGGEEFVAVLPNTSGRQALHIAEAMRQAVRELEIPHPGTAVGIVTISLGVAAGEGAALEPDALLQAADGALYRAKESGRDRVEGAPAAGSERPSD